MFKTFLDKAGSFLSPKPTAAIVDLSENPMDARPAVNHIVATIEEALSANPEKIVVAIVGEYHRAPFHHIARELTLDALTANGHKPLVALEQPHNLVQMSIALQFPGFDTPETSMALRTLKQEDPAHYHRLQTMACAGLTYGYAPATSHIVASNLHARTNIPVRMVDLAMTKQGSIDTTDDWTSRIVEEAGYSSQRLYASTPENIHVRNIGMLEKMIEEAKQTGSRLVLAPHGLAHIFGLGNQLPYQQSLHALTRKGDLGITPVTVFFETPQYTADIIPKTDKKSAMRSAFTVIVKGGDSEIFSLSQEMGFFGGRSREPDYRREVEKICAIYEASGVESTVTEYAVQTSMKKNKAALQQQLEALTVKLS